MDKSEFDRFADEYLQLHAKNISASGEHPDFFAQYKIRDIAAELKARRTVPERALDFGSGVGNSIPWMKKYLPSTQMTCVDVSERSLQVAANRFPDSARFLHVDGQTLPFSHAEFDLAYAMCVFHHIDHAEHIRLLRELARVLAATGTLAIFEHNPYNPLTVQAVNTCEFDANAKLIAAHQMKAACLAAGFTRAEVRYRIFFPRALARLRVLEKYMTGVPLGAQYSIFARKG
ncbi:class I SAM-dependent methyltransferase [Ralstonia solanacearum]|uniref:class I SAM-dependent methyltransferase n=1 Tax=Ralstonia solanacearum TaxID=305 RepID=UPI0001D9833E|nr:class I SAM-dependent methyltransferase [Ralstonia solanacearum]CBJ52073.1 conserved hypothethical protein, S-adenosyl-L-methionine (SAM)-dependent methyltransferase domain [Ralstonia solanacearum PSI07]